MHPRCRSTISAIVEGGKRTAKGKTIKAPAEMKHSGFKAAYLDKNLLATERRVSGAKDILTARDNIDKLQVSEGRAKTAQKLEQVLTTEDLKIINGYVARAPKTLEQFG